MAWTCNLPVACQTLLVPELMYQDALKETLEKISTEFTWLNEIVTEAYSLFSVESSQLQHMPKTPSMKQRGLERCRKKVETAKDNSPIPTNIVSKKLQFERETVSTNTTIVNRCIETAQNCHKTSRTVCAENNRFSTKVTQQSRNPLCDKSSELKLIGKLSPGQDESKENKRPVRDIPNKTVAGGTFSKLRRVPGKETLFSPVLNKKPEEKNQNLRKCVVARETVLKSGTSKDQLELKNANKMTHVVSNHNISSSKLDTYRNKDGSGSKPCNLKSLCDTSHILQLSEPCTSKPISQNGKFANKISSQAKNVRQVNTRLKLKEQTQHKQDDMESGMHCGVNKEVISSLSQADKTSNLSVYQQNRDTCEYLTGKDSVGMPEDIINIPCQSDAFNETVTVVTEVYEIVGNGRPCRLKEFEIVKTKTTPASDIIKPQTCLALTDSGYDHPYSSIDHSFNDDNDVTNESSDKSQVHGKKSTEKDIDDDPSTQKEVNVPTHTLVKKNNMDIKTTTATKPNKDSGFHSGRVKPALSVETTFTKNKTSSEDDMRSVKTACTRTESPLTEEEYVEDTLRATGQRQDRTPDIDQNRSNMKCLTEKSVASSRAKWSSISNTKSKVLHEQKLNKLIEKENSRKEQLRKAAELRKTKMEEQKKLREEKEQRFAAAREMRLRNEQAQIEKINKRQEATDRLKEKLREEKCNEDKEKIKQRLKKQMETDARRLEEEGEQAKKLIEQEEEIRTQEENMKKKKEFDEAERKRRIAEERKKQEERLAENEQKRKEEKIRLKQAEEEKERERERLRKEKEKQVAYERAEQERIERKKKEEKDRKIQEEYEKLKTMERERLRLEQEKMHHQQTEVKQTANKPSDSPAKKPMTADLNTTQILSNKRVSKTTGEKQVAYERAEQERIERKKKEEKDRKIQEEYEKLKTMERERLRQEQEKIHHQQAGVKQVVNKPSDSPAKKPVTADLNTTQILSNNSASKTTGEKQVAYERAEQERKKKEEKDRKIQEEYEKLKTMERERLRREQERIHNQQAEVKQAVNKPSDSQTKKPMTADLSTTQILSKNGASKTTSSYQMTPGKKNIVSSKSSHSDNYNIEDKGSDDSTDDDEAPKKMIPEWASGIPLNTALIKQHSNPPNIEHIFRTSKVKPPDLVILFPGRRKPRYNQRTSSAIWNSPPLLQH